MGFNSAASPNDIAKKIINFKNLSYKSKVSMARNARKFAINELDIKKLYKVYSNIFYQNLNL